MVKYQKKESRIIGFGQKSMQNRWENRWGKNDEGKIG